MSLKPGGVRHYKVAMKTALLFLLLSAGVALRDHNTRTTFCQYLRSGEPDAGRAPGDNCDLARQTHSGSSGYMGRSNLL